MPMHVSRFGIPELVAETEAELEPIILQSDLALTLDLPRNLPPMITDRQKVKQILHNLVSNALKFTRQGTVTIRARHRARRRTLEVAVVDTGIGIARQDQERVFEDFSQIDNSPTRAYGGTGLGLSICRRLAEMLGGRLTLKSEIGKGSAFTLTLSTQSLR
jgi:two-component system, cell cycle sensor histidine kinase PleC